jgi:hypothetical protein
LIGIPISSGHVVFDLDLYKGVSISSIEKVLGCALNWDSAELQTTPRGGRHCGFRIPEGVELRQGSDVLGVIGFDVRAAGKGYIATCENYTDLGLVKLSPHLNMLPELPAAAIAALSVPPPNPPAAAQPVCSVPPELVRSALSALPVEYVAERGKWFEIGCAIKSALGDSGWSLFDEFSRRAPEHYNQRENLRQWNSIKPVRDHGANINADTIFYYARLNGWAGDLKSLGFGVPAVPQQPTWATPVDLSSVMTGALPPRFVTETILPAGTTTLLGAHGGTGKSMLALQWSIAVALGLPFFAAPTEQQRVLFYSAEDNADIIRWRLRKICKQQNIEPAALADRLLILDATEIDATLYSEDARTRTAVYAAMGSTHPAPLERIGGGQSTRNVPLSIYRG